MNLARRLRVLFLASYFPKPDNPWMGTWALTQAQALARQNIELLVVSGTSWLPSFMARTPGAKAYANCPSEYVWEGGVRVLYPRWLYYPISPIKQWAYHNPTPYLQVAWWSVKQELCRIIEQFQPDILFCHHSLPNGWLIAHLPAHFQKPIITLDHDFDEVEDAFILPQRRSAMQLVSDRAWAMLAVSKRMEKNLKQLFPKTQIFTQHLGIDPLPATLFNRLRPASLKGKTIVLACALFAERKGIPLLVEAFGQVAERYPDAVLRIVGSGSEQEKIESAIQHWGLTKRVQMISKKPHQEVLQEMVWADCFALVGWDEPFGMVYLEAMAAGKPIICCNDCGMTDLIQDGIHGYTVPPKDVTATVEALDRMLGNEMQRQIMGHQAQRLVLEKLTWDVKTQELIQLFEQAAYSRQFMAAA